MKNRMLLTGLVIILLACTLKTEGKKSPVPVQKSEDAKMAWWHEAKFGMFIHWGLYAVPANSSEWNMRNLKKSIAEYSSYAKQFNPVKFNADEWARIANEAGMRYMVITTKHHDGFALFKSEASPYNMVDATPFKRDIIKELAVACPKNDIRLGLYYSLMADWGHPGGGIGNADPWDPAQVGNSETYFNTIAYPQVKEILSNYGPIAELWFDTDGTAKPDSIKTAKLQKLIRNLQPQVIMNKRVIPGDFVNAERHIPAQAIPGNWEACDITINGSWGYMKYKPENVRPVPELVKQMVDVVSKGGNYLLNVGPKADGSFPDDVIRQLKGIGGWMKVNGEAIYGITASPFDYLSWGRCTQKGNHLYLHVFEPPTNGIIRVPMSNKVNSVKFLKNNEALKYKTENEELKITLPSTSLDPIVTVLKVEVQGDIEPVHSIAMNSITSASAADKKSKFVVDKSPETYWGIPEAKPSWITVDMQSPKTFNTIRIGLKRGRVTKFSIDYWKDGKWAILLKGKNLPLDEYVLKIDPVRTQKVRLNLEKFSSPQEIMLGSFELFDAR